MRCVGPVRFESPSQVADMWKLDTEHEWSDFRSTGHLVATRSMISPYHWGEGSNHWAGVETGQA